MIYFFNLPVKSNLKNGPSHLPRRYHLQRIRVKKVFICRKLILLFPLIFQDSEGPDLAILTSKQAASRSHLDHRTGKTGTDDAVSKRAVFSSATSWRTRNHTTLGLGKDSVPTIPLRKNAQLYLNGVGAKNGTKSDQNLAVTLQPLEKVEKQNSVSAKQGRKLVNFSDIQRDVAPKKKDHPVEIRTKSVKKYR